MGVIDFSARFPSAGSIKSANHEGVVAYISKGREAWMGGKDISKATHDAYVKAGLKVAFVWQYGGVSNPDAMRGYNGGVADARAAKAKLDAIGRPNARVFFAIDFDITLHQWNNTASKYFDGLISVLGKDRVGIYGHSRVIAWAIEDNKIAKLSDGRHYAWQTKAWSNGVRLTKDAVLYQGVVNVAGPDGVKIDINEVWSSKYAENASGGATPPNNKVVSEMKYDHNVSSQFVFGGPRSTSQIKRIVIHTTENQPGTPPLNVSSYQTRTQSGSYHVLVGSNGTTVLCNTDDWITWSTGNAQGNNQGLNLSFVVYASQSRQAWLSQDRMLEQGAKQVALWAKKYGIRIYKSNGDDGICGHADMRKFGGTDHTDPGVNFPWDVFIKKVQKHANNLNGSSNNEAGDEEMAVKDYFEKTLYNSAVAGSKAKNSMVSMMRLVDKYTWELAAKKYKSKVKGSNYKNTLPGYITDISANVVNLNAKVDKLSKKLDEKLDDK